MFEIGRLCVKTAGREAGKYCVIIKNIDPKFVLITGPKELTKVKRRKCNIAHLEPLPHTIKLSAEASDAEVLKAYQTEGIYEKLGLKALTKEELKARQDARAEKARAKAERVKREEKAREEAKDEKPKKIKEKGLKEKARPKEEKTEKPKTEKQKGEKKEG